MSDIGYSIVRGLGYPIFWITSRPLVLHLERVRRRGAFILAANHLSPYDVPALMGVVSRKLDFVSIVEMQRTPVVGWLFGIMNCEFVDRERADVGSARALAQRLARGRVVAMFPESGIRAEETSVIHGGRFKPGVVRLAQLTGTSIVPCVIVGTRAFRHFASWLPLRRTSIGVIFGEPIDVPDGPDAHAIRTERMAQLARAYRDLYAELREATELRDAASGHLRSETSHPQTPEPR